MKIGITATQIGLTNVQLVIAREFLFLYDELHHGDCIGGDEQIGSIAYEMGIRVITHPPTNSSKRAYGIAHETRKPKPYLERNHDIVDETDQLVAFPKTEREELRSGTWATVRYARKVGKRVHIVTPSGKIYNQ